MAAKRQPVENKRRSPRQARAAQTVDAILEAAAQVLERGGLAALTTNAVAERAGVSIGTLYQYFAHKNAVLMSLAECELAAAQASVARALRDDPARSAEQRVRATVRAMLNAFGGRQRARKAVLQVVLAQGLGQQTVSLITAFISRTASPAGKERRPMFGSLSAEQAFVVSHALTGAIRAAVLEERPALSSKAFEDELVRLVMAYLAALPPSSRPAASPA